MTVHRMMLRTAAFVAMAVLLASCQQTREEPPPVAASPQAQATIDDYLRKVDGRFGALAMSQDGARATYYICQSRLWKNCDDYSLEDSFISTPSGHLAADLAERRCRGYAGGSGGCVVLFVNDTWKYQFTLAQ